MKYHGKMAKEKALLVCDELQSLYTIAICVRMGIAELQFRKKSITLAAKDYLPRRQRDFVDGYIHCLERTHSLYTTDHKHWKE